MGKISRLSNPGVVMGGETLQKETSAYRLSITDDGILIFRHPRGVVIDLDIAHQTVAEAARVAGGIPRCILVNLEGIKRMDRAARQFYTKLRGAEAIAMVGVSPVARVLGNIFISLNKHPVMPFRMFAKESDALDWLRTFLD